MIKIFRVWPNYDLATERHVRPIIENIFLTLFSAFFSIFFFIFNEPFGLTSSTVSPFIRVPFTPVMAVKYNLAI